MWVVSLVVAETLGMFGFDTFETLKSKHETAREVGTFKNARLAAQDCRKSTYFVKNPPPRSSPQLTYKLTHLPATPKYARARASDPSP